MATDTLANPASLSASQTRVFKNFIDGQWVDSSSGDTFENRNPADTRDLVGIFQKSNREDVNAAVDAAKRAFAKWRLVPAPRRAAFTSSLFDLSENADQVARVGGIAILESISARGINPLAVDEILENARLS